jgi:hypothetical protein
MPFDGTRYGIDSRIVGLIAARERVRCGWCQNFDKIEYSWWEFWAPKERVCAGEAIDWRDDLLVPLLHALRAPFGDTDDLCKWNDARGRTQTEVIALFDRAIDSLFR